MVKDFKKKLKDESSESSTTDISDKEDEHQPHHHHHQHGHKHETGVGGSCCSNDKKEAETLVARMAEVLRRAKDSPGDAKELKITTSTHALAYLCENNIVKRTQHQGSVERMPLECRGSGGGIIYPPQTKFIFNYRVRDPMEPDVFLDDTKKYGKEMELYSGKDFQIEVRKPTNFSV